MGEGYIKFRKRLRLEMLLKTAVLSLSAGLFASGLFILIVKLCGADLGSLAWLWYLLTALGAVAATCGILLPMLYPTKKRVAKRLDGEFSLSERVQTMIEYEGQQGLLVELQRQNTEERLSALSRKALKPTKIIATALVTVISASLFITALAIPVLATSDEPTVEEENPMDAEDKELLIISIRELITKMEKSLVQQTLKDAVIYRLENLIGIIEATEFFSVMKAGAISAVRGIREDVSDTNSSAKIGQALSDTGNELLKPLGDALLNAASTETKKRLIDICDALKEAEDTGLDASFFVNEQFYSVVVNSDVDYDDELKVALLEFILTLSVAVQINVYDGIEAVAELSHAQIAPILLTQFTNKQTTGEVVTTLMSLFGITESDLVQDGSDGDSDEEDKDDEDKEDGELSENDKEDDVQQDGGLSDESVNMGGEGVIYYPKDDKYVHYSEVIYEYSSLANALVSKGELDPSLLDAIRDYFDALSGASGS